MKRIPFLLAATFLSSVLLIDYASAQQNPRNQNQRTDNGMERNTGVSSDMPQRQFVQPLTQSSNAPIIAPSGSSTPVQPLPSQAVNSGFRSSGGLVIAPPGSSAPVTPQTTQSISPNTVPQRVSKEELEGIASNRPSSSTSTLSPAQVDKQKARTEDAEKPKSREEIRRAERAEKEELRRAERAERNQRAVVDRSSNRAPAVEVQTVPRELKSSGVWIARKGRSLREILTEWSRASGWTIAWRADSEYFLQASAEFQGEFIDAASTLLESFQNASPPVQARFFKGNKALVVTTPDNADLN